MQQQHIEDEILDADILMDDNEVESMDSPEDENESVEDLAFQDIENTPENQLRILEAMLFATSKPITPQMMLERLPEGADLNILLPQLREKYEGGGIALMEVGGHYAFRTAQDVAKALVVEKGVEKKMSKAALETLSVVAYHQPITRAEIENIRGVATNKGTLDILMEMGWVRPGRRRETPGRPLTWITTSNFLDHFQLESLNDLPGLEDLKNSGLLDKRAAIDALPGTGDLFDDADVDAQEVLDSQEGDEDAYDEASYKEIRAKAQKMQESEEEASAQRAEEFDAQEVEDSDDDEFDDEDEYDDFDNEEEKD